MKIMNVYVLLINTIYNCTKRINKRIKNSFLTISCILLGLWYILYSVPQVKNYLFSIYYFKNHNLNSKITFFVLLFMIVFFSVDREVRTIKWNKTLLVLYYVFPILVLITNLYLNVSEAMVNFAIELLTLIPCLIIIWNNRTDYSKLYNSISIGFSLSGFLYYVNCFLVSKKGLLRFDLETQRFYATFSNPNIIGLIYMVAVVSSIYRIYTNHKNIASIFINCIVIAIGTIFIFLSGCRSALLVMFFSLIVLIIFIIKNINVKDFKLILQNNKKIMAIFIFSFAIITIMTNIMLQNNNAIKFNNNNDNSNVLSQYVNSNYERIVAKNKDMNAISGGRLDVWNAYLSNITILGHDCEDYAYKLYPYRAHNNLLEICYFIGLPAGILYTIYLICIGFYVFKIIIDKKCNSNICFYISMISVAFAIQSMIEVAVEIDYQGIVFCFYLAIMPFFNNEFLNKPDKYE